VGGELNELIKKEQGLNLWQYYFSICEAGFKTKTLGCVMFTVGREGNGEMIDDVLKACEDSKDI
jgi:hypothetical protein